VTGIQSLGWLKEIFSHKAQLPYLDVMKRLSRGKTLISSTLLSFPLAFEILQVFLQTLGALIDTNLSTACSFWTLISLQQVYVI